MCRYARSGLAAVIMFAIVGFLGSPHATPSAQAAAPYRIFAPIAVTSPPFWSAQELQAVDLINQHRHANGCAPVQLNYELGIAAKNHSRDMAEQNYFSHTGLDGSTYWQRARAAQYPYWPSGEIIGAGYANAAEVVQGWIDSPDHRAIILTCDNDDIGIGFYSRTSSQWQHYWTAVYGQR